MRCNDFSGLARYTLSLWVVATAAVVIPCAVRADDGAADVAGQRETFPRISGEIRAEIENDSGFSAVSGAPDRRQNLLFSTVQPEFSIEFNENLSIETELTLEPIEDPDERDNEEFESEGAFVAQLFLNWKNDRVSVSLGKFQPLFGLAFEASTDLFGDEYPFGYEEFSEDVEITERLGGSVSFEAGNDRIGSNVLTLDVFQADTSNLSRSILRHREKFDRREGGVSNTGNPSSFGIHLTGEELPALPGLSYHLGFVYQDADRVPLEDDEADMLGEGLFGDDEAPDDDSGIDPALTGRPQRGYVGDLTYSMPLSERVELKLASEFLYLDNADSEANHIRRLLTLAASTVVDENLYLGLSYARRTNDLTTDRDSRDFLLQASAAYFREIGPGKIGFEAAVRRSREERDRFRTLGFRLIYRAEF